jgi:hypothetical protein
LITDRIGELPKDVDVFLMQQSVKSSQGARLSASAKEEDSDDFAAVQVVLQVTVRMKYPKPDKTYGICK